MSEIEIKTYSLTNAVAEKEIKKEKSIKSTSGLRKGAYSVIFLYVAIMAYIKPFSIDLIPYGFAVNKMFVIPESVYILVTAAALSLLFSLAGTIMSILRLSLLGFLLSFIIFGNTIYFSAKGYSIYKENPVMVDRLLKEFDGSEIFSKISFVKKSDITKVNEASK